MLRAEGVSVRLGGARIVDALDLAVRPGAVTVLIGPNGAGKSTALRAMSGEQRPAAGRVTLDGTDIRSLRPAALARARAVLPQAAVLSFPFTVLEIVRLGAEAGGAGGAQADAHSRAALDRVGMTRFAERIVPTLSGGEQQRTHLARILAQACAAKEAGGGAFYLLLDEPTASLDLEHQILTLEIARDFAERGGGVLAVLHDLNLASMAADELVAMKAGRVVARGAPAGVLTDDLVRSLYNVRLRVGCVPAPPVPFVLPQSGQAGPEASSERADFAQASLHERRNRQ